MFYLFCIDVIQACCVAIFATANSFLNLVFLFFFSPFFHNSLSIFSSPPIDTSHCIPFGPSPAPSTLGWCAPCFLVFPHWRFASLMCPTQFPLLTFLHLAHSWALLCFMGSAYPPLWWMVKKLAHSSIWWRIMGKVSPRRFTHWQIAVGGKLVGPPTGPAWLPTREPQGSSP